MEVGRAAGEVDSRPPHRSRHPSTRRDVQCLQGCLGKVVEGSFTHSLACHGRAARCMEAERGAGGADSRAEQSMAMQ